MVLNYKSEINDLKLVCLLTVFDGLFQRKAAPWWKLFFPASVYGLCTNKYLVLSRTRSRPRPANLKLSIELEQCV